MRTTHMVHTLFLVVTLAVKGGIKSFGTLSLHGYVPAHS